MKRPALSLLSAALLMSATAYGAAPADNARDLTQDLVKLIKNSHANGKAHGLEAKAQARQQALLALADNDPQAAVELLIPAGKQQGLDASVLAYLEQPVAMSGEVQTLVADHEDGSFSHQYLLNTPFGDQIPLKGKGLGKLSGKGEVQLGGAMLGSEMLVDDSNILVMAADGSTTTSNGGTAGASGTVTGEQKTLVVLANFSDDPQQPWTKDAINSLVFGTVNDVIMENAQNKAWLSGDVYGWYTLGVSSSQCDFNTVVPAFKEAASANGVDLSAYSRYVFITPKTSSCGFTGLSTVGGNPAVSLINGQVANWQIITHEMGHGMGLYHAHALECGANVEGSSCTSSEYGDITDPMGKGLALFGARNREALGWLNVTDASNGGVYTLGGYAGTSGYEKAIKIAKGDGTYYYLSYRQPTGLDSSLATANFENGVVFHEVDPSNGNAQYLLDMTPGSGTTNTDFYDPALVAGYSYQSGNVQVDTLSAGGDTAEVSVIASGSSADSCVAKAPSVVLSPGQSPWLAAGSAATYTVSVTNNDSAACATGTVSLAKSLPSGWSATLGASSLSLAPGSSANTTLVVSSASTAVDGFYTVQVSASQHQNSVSSSATYVVDNPASSTNSAPVANNDSATTSGSSVVIAVLSNDTDADGDTLSISSFTQGSKGSVTQSGNNLIYTPARNFKNGDSFSYTVTDGTASASATVTIGVASSSGSTSGGSTGGGGKGRNK